MSESTPDVATEPGDELLLELADDYLRRCRAGEQPTVDEYVSKHPELADRIRELFPAMIAMEQPGPGATVDLAPPTERVGAMVGRYKLLERIGEGGFGVVYMAEQQQPVRRKVALKVLKPGMDSRQVLARFEAERQALAIMDHPNIAKVFDAGATDSGRPYFVMELVRGEPITDFCDRNQFSPRVRLELFAQVCHAVQHAHQKGIIHRDIKPTNVLVGMHDTTPVVKVIDFGVAKALGQELTDKTLFTGFAQFLGTPLYMSPEQAGQSVLDVDTRSDIYSLGVLLYELLTGTTPFDKERFKQAAQDEIFRIIREEEPPTPSTRLSSLSLGERAWVRVSSSLASISAQRQMEPTKLTKLVRGELDWIVMKALEKERTRRYETASGMARDIERYLHDDPVEACPPSALYRFKKFVRRNKAKLVTASVVGAALLVAVGMFGWAARDRSARQAKVAGQVESILTKVDQLEREQKWPEALAAARQADAVVTGGEADGDTTRRVRAHLKNLEFIDRLEQVRILAATWLAEKSDHDRVARAYARAFRDYGVDVESLSVESSVERLKASPPLVILAAAAALDAWAQEKFDAKGDAADSKRLVEIARGIDPEPVRDGLRSTWGRPASDVQDELSRLAESIDIRAHAPATLVRLARSLRGVNRADLALRLEQDALVVYPGDFWLNFGVAQLLSDQNDLEGAVRFYTAAVAIRPNVACPRYNLGVVLLLQKKLDDAIVAFRRAIEIDPEFTWAYTLLGRALRDQGKLDESTAALRKAIKIDSKDADVYCHLGMTLRRQNKLDESIAAYRQAIDIDPLHTYSYNNLAELLTTCSDVKFRDPEQAVALREELLAVQMAKRGPDHGDTLSTMNEVLSSYEALGPEKLDEAIDKYRKAIEADPMTASECRQILSLLLHRRGKFDEAITVCRQAIEVDPQDARAYHTLGLCLRDQGNHDEAFAAYSKGIEINPNNPELRGVRASAYAAMGEWDKAAADYEKQLQLNPTDHWPWYFRGCMLAYLGRTQDYTEHCRAMLTQFANTADYGILERTTKTALLLPDGVGSDVDQMTRCAERACLQIPNSPWNLLLKGMAECRAGRYEEATGLLEKCRAVPPDDYFARTGLVTADAFLAVARYQLGHVDEARSALDRATDQASKIWPPVGSSDWSKVNVDHWLIAQTAMREAAFLLLGQHMTTAPTQ